jgi:acyl-CoA thioesterase-1
MRQNNIRVDDLYRLALPRLKELQLPKNVHFTSAGSDVLAGQVAQEILRALAGRK